MQLKKATRKQVKLRLNIASASGFGKTYSALLLAYGMTQDWNKIAVIDTENESASLYSNLGEFKSLPFSPPYSPARYIEAIKICENAGVEVIIIDSITHVWKGQGGLLEYQNSLGGRYQDWAKTTPLYQNWLNTILQSKCHVITTVRKKQSYDMVNEGGKLRVKKVGLSDEIRDGFEYEVTTSFEIINDKHLARASKDRTNLFVNQPEFVITPATGKKLLDWCNHGLNVKEEALELIKTSKTINELIEVYNRFPTMQEELKKDFAGKKIALEAQKNKPLNINPQTFSTNGTTRNNGVSQ